MNMMRADCLQRVTSEFIRARTFCHKLIRKGFSFFFSFSSSSGVGGVFPKGLLIGTVEEVQVENHGMSLYAVIEPVVDITSVKDVIVITEFEGQTVEETPAEDASEKAEDDR